jgi:hypothetical protein
MCISCLISSVFQRFGHPLQEKEKRLVTWLQTVKHVQMLIRLLQGTVRSVRLGPPQRWTIDVAVRRLLQALHVLQNRTERRANVGSSANL